jgi:hypothetical protein
MHWVKKSDLIEGSIFWEEFILSGKPKERRSVVKSATLSLSLQFVEESFSSLLLCIALIENDKEHLQLILSISSI